MKNVPKNNWFCGMLLWSGVLMLGGCADDKPVAQSLTVQGSLLGFVAVSGSATRRTALYLLAELVLGETDLEMLEESCQSMADPLDQLFCQYALARRLQSVENTNLFVALFPTDGKAMNTLLMDTTQHVFPSGLFDLLADAARLDDAALRKLVSCAESADGVAAGMLYGYIDDIRNNNAERFVRVIGEAWVEKH